MMIASNTIQSNDILTKSSNSVAGIRCVFGKWEVEPKAFSWLFGDIVRLLFLILFSAKEYGLERWLGRSAGGEQWEASASRISR